MIKLPFKLEINAPISKVLKNTQQPIKYDKQIAFALNRIYKQKLRASFISIKTSQLQSPKSYFKLILASAKPTKRQHKISYPTYNPLLQPPQPQVPKTLIFNHRIKSLKTSAFLKIKQFSLDSKTFQVTTVVQNRQTQLLNHFIPKIQQKVYAIVFRVIVDYAKDKKGKSKIVRLIDNLDKNITKRVHFSDFFNKLKAIKSKEGKKTLSCQKIFKLLKLSQRYVIENALRKIQLHGQSLSLQAKLSEKKQTISKIHEINTERTVLVQKERQALRNLKYKLDQESIEKNHILTEKRRSLMLARTKFTQESKQMTEQMTNLSAEVFRLSRVLEKQSHIIKILEQNKECLKDLKRRGIDFESITLTVYKAIHDVGEEGLNGFCQIVRHHELKWNHVENMLLLDKVQNRKDYQCRIIAFMQRIIKAFERKEGQSELNASRLNPLGSTASTSQLKFSPIASSLKSSRVTNGPLNSKGRIHPDPAELIRLKEEYSALQSFISLILSKSYEVKIKEAISAEIEQLSELLASDLKENQE